ncbi:MAG: YkvA family protein [Hydrogenophaga sp.]|nr:YkvA family protein [Hydrogenophaga sp.]
MWKRLSVIWLAVRGDAKRLWYALGHPESPGWLKAGAAALVLYLVSPIDFIPDMLPVIGVLDDLVIVPLALRWLLARLPAHIRAYAERRAGGVRATDGWTDHTVR